MMNRRDTNDLLEGFCAYLELNRGRAPRTVAQYRVYLLRLAKHFDDPLRATPQELEQFVGLDQHKAGLGPRSRRVLVSAVRGFFSWAARQGVVDADPARDLPYPEWGFRFPVALELKYAEHLVMAPDLNTFAGVRDCAMLMILLGCGLRVSELVGLNDADLEFRQHEGRERLILRVRGKGNRERLVPAPQEAWAMLRCYLGHSDLHGIDRVLPTGNRVLFVSVCNRMVREDLYRGEARRLCRSSVYRMLRKYGDAAGVPAEQCHPHALRHLYATELAESGTDLLDIQANLGHKSLESTRIYIHLAMSRRMEVADRHGPLRKIQTPVSALLRHLSTS